MADHGTPSTCEHNLGCNWVHHMLDNRVLHLEDKLRKSQAPVDSAASTDRTGPADTAVPDTVYYWDD